jgi:hypothetical protein
MLRSVRVPSSFQTNFERAESFVEQWFADMDRRPHQGTLHIGGERYVLVRAASLYLTWFEELEASFGEEPARDFIYNTAREIGRSDSAAFSARFGLSDGLDRLSAGPVHFAHAGWALVEILEDSTPSRDESYYLHYLHPNTFESEVLAARGRRLAACGCWFSAGYSAGWCSDAFAVEVHGRELRCLSKGDDRCEFVMAPSERLDERSRAVLSG